MKELTFPLKLGRRKQVIIYRETTESRGHQYVKYTVSYSIAGERNRKSFSDFKEAKEFGDKRKTEIESGQLSLDLEPEEAMVYSRALEALEPTGLPLDIAMQQFAEAWRILGGRSIVDCARQSATASARCVRENVTVADTVTELLKDREVNGVSTKYLYQLGRSLRRFTMHFRDATLVAIDGPAIKQFLDGLDCKARGKGRRAVTARTRNNYRDAIGLVFEFAKFKRYLSKDFESVEHIAKYREAMKPTTIYTPAEIETLLRIAEADHPELVTFLAIGAFAGIRHQEITRLDWRDISLAERHIQIQAGKAKTASRRMVPVSENLAAWLSRHEKPFGPVCEPLAGDPSDAKVPRPVSYPRNMAERISRFVEGKAVRKTGFVWKRNALRHSFISYRLALTNNAAATSLEAGNSPHMVHRFYKALVTLPAAKEWFSVMPMIQEAAAKPGPVGIPGVVWNAVPEKVVPNLSQTAVVLD